jgi:dipeptide/tripeptide permease
MHSGKTWQNAFSQYIIKYVFLAKIRYFGKIKNWEKKKRERKNCYVAVILFLADICQILT